MPSPHNVSPLVARIHSSDIIPNLSIVPEDQLTSLQGAKFTAAEVLIPSQNATFPPTLVYALNRTIDPNDGPRGDAITVLTPTRMENSGSSTNSLQLRGMQFGGPDNRFRIASGLIGDGGIVVFMKRVGQGAESVQVASNIEGHSEPHKLCVGTDLLASLALGLLCHIVFLVGPSHPESHKPVPSFWCDQLFDLVWIDQVQDLPRLRQDKA